MKPRSSIVSNLRKAWLLYPSLSVNYGFHWQLWLLLIFFYSCRPNTKVWNVYEHLKKVWNKISWKCYSINATALQWFFNVNSIVLFFVISNLFGILGNIEFGEALFSFCSILFRYTIKLFLSSENWKKIMLKNPYSQSKILN